MTHADIKELVGQMSIIHLAAELYDEMYKESNHTKTNVIDKERFMYAVVDCMFKRNMQLIIDADRNNPIHKRKVEILVYQCADELLHNKAQGMIAILLEKVMK